MRLKAEVPLLTREIQWKDLGNDHSSQNLMHEAAADKARAQFCWLSPVFSTEAVCPEFGSTEKRCTSPTSKCRRRAYRARLDRLPNPKITKSLS